MHQMWIFNGEPYFEDEFYENIMKNSILLCAQEVNLTTLMIQQMGNKSQMDESGTK